MDAVIMAGGKGVRMLPYTETTPKPLLRLGKDRIIEILLHQLRRHGLSRVFISLGHMANQVRDTLGDGSRFGLSLSYVQEDYPLGTCGSLAEIIDQLGESFVVANGDLLMDVNLAAMIAEHDRNAADATVGVFSHTESSRYGVLTIDASGAITRYQEKPTRSVDVSMGIYVLRRRAVRHLLLRRREKLDMPDLIQSMIGSGAKVAAFRGTRFWIDIGTPSEYKRAAELVAADPFLTDSRS
jgi:NDP-sugar pyrophosphorylase family protein